MIRVTEIKFHLSETFCDESIRKKIAQKLKVKPNQVIDYKIIRESIDARKEIQLSYTIDVNVEGEKSLIKRGFKLAPVSPIPIHEGLSLEDKLKLSKASRPIVIGFGPAGMFCALQLALCGLKPIVFEMGEAVDQRLESVEKFWDVGILNEKSNVQFGEGGAGTFSDGKLTTRIKDQRVSLVIDAFIQSGAPDQIAYAHKPHIGTDILIGVVKNIRERIQSLGGEVYFNSEVTDILIEKESNSVVGVEINGGKCFKSNRVVCATGHSARNFFELLYKKNISIEQKPFAVGFRIEHPQKIINASQYGKQHGHDKLGAAEYKLSYTCESGKSVYTFCMCPGGRVVGSASEEGLLVVNGMSYSARDLVNANSALLVTVETKDFQSDHPLAGMAFQREIERKAFVMGAGNYCAPIQRLGNFLKSNESYDGSHYMGLGVDYDLEMNALTPTYTPKTVEVNLEELLPSGVIESLREAIPYFGKKINGFDDPRAILTGVETRSSSPVRVLRDSESYQSISHKGLFPCGEGAGYAGGITSSAVDGIKIAEFIIKDVLK